MSHVSKKNQKDMENNFVSYNVHDFETQTESYGLTRKTANLSILWFF